MPSVGSHITREIMNIGPYRPPRPSRPPGNPRGYKVRPKIGYNYRLVQSLKCSLIWSQFAIRDNGGGVTNLGLNFAISSIGAEIILVVYSTILLLGYFLSISPLVSLVSPA